MADFILRMFSRSTRGLRFARGIMHDNFSTKKPIVFIVTHLTSFDHINM